MLDAKKELPEEIEADLRLVSRCLMGEVAAWEELYGQRHDALCRSIRTMLGAARSDLDLVDEIAARVWYRLVANDGELLSRYAPERKARLITFMRGLARDEIGRRARSEARRRHREHLARKMPPLRSEDPGCLSSLDEFLATLTPQEHRFCREVLLGEAGAEGPLPRSKAGAWQLRHRIREKLLQFTDRPSAH